MSEQIKALKDKAAAAAKAARELAPKVTAGDTTALEAFNKAKDEAIEAMKLVQSMEALDDVDVQLAAPARESHSREAAARETMDAGGGTAIPKDKAFREAHRAAFLDFLRYGPGVATTRLSKVTSEQHALDIVNGKMTFTPEEQHMLVGKDLELGGFLIPEDVRMELIRNLPGFAVVRGNATVKTTSGRAVTWPTVLTGSDPYSSNMATGNTNAANSNWKGEGAYGADGSAPTAQDKPTFGNVRVPTHVWEPSAVVLGRDLISDSAVDLETEVTKLFAEVKALDEDWAFINGDGNGKPRGILWNVDGTGGIVHTVGSDASLIKYAGYINTFTALPAQYRQRAKWLMNSVTYGKTLLLESTAGFPLFPPNSLPNQILGKDVLFSEFMPAVAGNAFPVVFGDFSYYYVVDQTEVRVQRLVERFAPNLGILVFARTGGQVVRTVAFRAMKIATS